MKLDKNEALYLFVNDKKLIPAESPMNEIYQKDKDADGFLYIHYREEMVYG